MSDTLYSRNGIVITASTLRVGPDNYPIKNISAFSTSSVEVPPPRGGSTLLLILGFAASCGLSIAVHRVMPDAPDAIGAAFFIGVVLALGAWVWMRGREKPSHRHTLKIATGGMQKNAVTVTSREDFDAIVAAMDRAVGSR